MSTFFKPLAWALPIVMLLAGCNGSDKDADKDATKPEPHTTYKKADFSALPPVTGTDLQSGFASWRSACIRLKADPNWGSVCSDAATLSASPSVEQISSFLQTHLDVYSLRSAEGSEDGLITGYYEPVSPERLKPTQAANVPTYGVPSDLIVVNLDSIYPELKGKRLRGRLEGRVLKPYDTAETINSKGLNAPVLAWLTDPMDLQFLQIQGSGRVQLDNGRQLRIGYADQNGHPYKPIGRWLVEQGELKKEDVTMSTIHAWAMMHPERVHEMLASNPSYVFFTQNPDSTEGPRGSLNVPLTAGYSVAVDRKVIPLGSLLWLSTTQADGQPIVRPVAAQDTGGAIAGEVRADFFVGTGPEAGQIAGDMKQKGNIWLLWPKGAALPL